MQLPHARPLIALVLTFASGCAGHLPWRVASAPHVPPDDQFRTGGNEGYDVYRWNCVEDHHVIIRAWCGGVTGCEEPVVERVGCDAQTQFERTGAFAGERHAIPANLQWPGASTPAAQPAGR